MQIFKSPAPKQCLLQKSNTYEEVLTFKRNLSWIFFPQPAHSWGPATFPQSSLTAMIMTTLSTFYKMTNFSSAAVYKIWISLISTLSPPQWSCSTNVLSFGLSFFLMVNQNLRRLPPQCLQQLLLSLPSFLSWIASEVEGNHCIFCWSFFVNGFGGAPVSTAFLICFFFLLLCYGLKKLVKQKAWSKAIQPNLNLTKVEVERRKVWLPPRPQSSRHWKIPSDRSHLLASPLVPASSEYRSEPIFGTNSHLLLIPWSCYCHCLHFSFHTVGLYVAVHLKAEPKLFS